MTIQDIFTEESVEQFNNLSKEAVENGKQLMDDYRDDHIVESKQISLSDWISALENGNLEQATCCNLWSRLAEDGYIETATNQAIHSNNCVFQFRIISPKIFDAFREKNVLEANYAYETLRVCFRRETSLRNVIVPEGWQEPILIDTEVFEVPHATTSVSNDEQEILDDMEKIHVVYLAGSKNGQFISMPVYIGVGTGEAYGTGPAIRDTVGRFRFYRYDAKDNHHLEFINVVEGLESKQVNVDCVPSIPCIGKGTSRQLLLGRGNGDSGFMCLSDPIVADAQADFFKTRCLQEHITKLIKLEKVHEELDLSKKPSTPFSPNDVRSVLAYAWQVYRWFYVAWLHPYQLTSLECWQIYYKQLPRWRREQYEIYRVRSELVDVTSNNVEEPLTIAAILASQDLRGRLEKNAPNAVQKLEEWIRNQLVKDLYHFGNHPELRLCNAIALWHRLADTGHWDQLVKATYQERLYEMQLDTNTLVTKPSGTN